MGIKVSKLRSGKARTEGFKISVRLLILTPPCIVGHLVGNMPHYCGELALDRGLAFALGYWRWSGPPDGSVCLSGGFGHGTA